MRWGMYGVRVCVAAKVRMTIPLPLVCKIPSLARRTRPAGKARRATIGYVVYKMNTN